MDISKARELLLKNLEKTKKQQEEKVEETSSYENHMNKLTEESNKQILDDLLNRKDKKFKEIDKLESNIASIRREIETNWSDLKTIIERLDNFNVKEKNGYLFQVDVRKRTEIPTEFNDFISSVKEYSHLGNTLEAVVSRISMGETKIFFGKKVDGVDTVVDLKTVAVDFIDELKQRLTIIDKDFGKITITPEYLIYSGDKIDWGQLVGCLDRIGFEKSENLIKPEEDHGDSTSEEIEAYKEAVSEISPALGDILKDKKITTHGGIAIASDEDTVYDGVTHITDIQFVLHKELNVKSGLIFGVYDKRTGYLFERNVVYVLEGNYRKLELEDIDIEGTATLVVGEKWKNDIQGLVNFISGLGYTITLDDNLLFENPNVEGINEWHIGDVDMFKIRIGVK